MRRRLVDATYIESSIPSRHVPPFTVDAGVRLIPPNDLVDLDPPAAGFTVLGAGKTAMDTCSWLLDAGVDPDAIEWFRPRDPWLFNRAATQPLDLVGSYMGLQASWVAAAATAADGQEFARRLEDDEIFVRIDPAIEPHLFRGADDQRERDRRPARRSSGSSAAARSATSGPARSSPTRATCPPTGTGSSSTAPPGASRRRHGGRCSSPTASRSSTSRSGSRRGARRRSAPSRPGTTTMGTGTGLCPPVVFTGDVADILELAYAGMTGLVARSSDAAVNEWTESSRLNPAKDAAAHLDDPRVPAAFDTIVGSIGDALTNLGRLVGATT